MLLMKNIGTKEWFQSYVKMMAEYKDGYHKDNDKEIIAGLMKFDPKFAELVQKAHAAGGELVTYAASKLEKP